MTRVPDGEEVLEKEGPTLSAVRSITQRRICRSQTHQFNRSSDIFQVV